MQESNKEHTRFSNQCKYQLFLISHGRDLALAVKTRNFRVILNKLTEMSRR